MKHFINVNDDAMHLKVAGGQSLFETLKDHGILLPSICGGRGLCGRCRLKVVKGGGPITPAEKSKLTAEEFADGFRLACQVEVGGDLSIAIPDELLAAGRFRGEVERIDNLTHDIKELRIRLIDPKWIEFAPGQHIKLEVPAYKGSPKPIARTYSLANRPGDNGYVELMVRFVPGGIATTWIFTVLKEGDEVSFSGPFGEFRLTEIDRDMIWVAGGSGMSPFWSIIRHLKDKGIRRRCTYFFGAVQRRDLFLLDELRRLEDKLDWFTFIPALSEPAVDDDWLGETGLITEVLDRHFANPEAEAYLCGAPGMIDAAIEVLRKYGITDDRIFYDKFA